MGLKNKYKRAEKIISNTDGEDYRIIKAICREIQVTQQQLVMKAADNFTRCLNGCHGLCCKNIMLDDIISLNDFILIQTLQPGMKPEIERCLEDEKIMFTADCIFLKNQTGPCLFPDDLKPCTCVTTFCDDTVPARKEIGAVKMKFLKLDWFIRWIWLKQAGGFLLNMINIRG